MATVGPIKLDFLTHPVKIVTGGTGSVQNRSNLVGRLVVSFFYGNDTRATLGTHCPYSNVTEDGAGWPTYSTDGAPFGGGETQWDNAVLFHMTQDDLTVTTKNGDAVSTPFTLVSSVPGFIDDGGTFNIGPSKDGWFPVEANYAELSEVKDFTFDRSGLTLTGVAPGIASFAQVCASGPGTVNDKLAEQLGTPNVPPIGGTVSWYFTGGYIDLLTARVNMSVLSIHIGNTVVFLKPKTTNVLQFFFTPTDVGDRITGAQYEVIFR